MPPLEVDLLKEIHESVCSKLAEFSKDILALTRSIRQLSITINSVVNEQRNLGTEIVILQSRVRDLCDKSSLLCASEPNKDSDCIEMEEAVNW